jgi:protein TonB
VQRRIDSTGNTEAAGRQGLADAVVQLGSLKPVRPDAEPDGPSAGVAGIVDALVLPELTPMQRRRRVAFKVAAVLSLLLHAGSLYAFLAWRGDPETGALDQPSDAISVEIVETRTLEAMQPKRASEPAPAPEATAPVEGKTEASDAEPVQPAPEPPREPQITVPRPPIFAPDAMEEVMRAIRRETSPQAEAPPVPVAGPAQVPPPPPKSGDEEDDAPAKEERTQPERKKAAERAPKGGVTSKAKAGKGKGGERQSASRGSLISYSARVRARVAGNKPLGSGVRGTAVVSFGVTTSGGLAYASVARSSGNAALDRLAVSAVRASAPFPTPPAGATPRQLTFTIPFYFE